MLEKERGKGRNGDRVREGGQQSATSETSALSSFMSFSEVSMLIFSD